jgi:hypothetical protein
VEISSAVLNTGCLVNIHTEADINEVAKASVYYTKFGKENYRDSDDYFK